jgi:hypothetical protein
MRISPVALSIICLLSGNAYASDVSLSSDALPFLQPTESYSGLRIIETAEGDFAQRLHWTPDKIRTETDLPGMSMINIVREDLGVMWIMPPGSQMCLEQPLDDNALAGMSGADALEPGGVEYSEIGADTIDGVEVTKYEVISEDDTGKNRALFGVTEHNIPLRMEVSPAAGGGQHDVVMRMEELEIGEQPASLFETGMECAPMPAVPTAPPGASVPGG